MRLDKKSLSLYLVSDRSWSDGPELLEQIDAAIDQGVSFLQIREKDTDACTFLERAMAMKVIAGKHKIPFVINDNVDVTVKSDADGIHIGQNDIKQGLGIRDIRSKIGNEKIIGVSVNTVEQALLAEAHGADYLGVGAVFPTSTKDDAKAVAYEMLEAICQAVRIPVVAIGGITRNNVLKLQGSGIDGAAVVSAILGQENVVEASQDMARLCGQLSQTRLAKVLTIAGSDCSGGAGIQADLKTMAAHNCYGMSVITALTAQNTTGVYGIENCKAEFVANQIDCIFKDMVPHAVKIGMVSSVEIISAIGKRLKHYRPEFLVVDPVMVSTSGSRLLEDDALEALKTELLPQATVITPNLSEAELLSGMSIQSAEAMIKAAQEIAKYYKGYILIKGGHSLNDANDLLYREDQIEWFEGERVDNVNTHGTGCTLSSAIASNLALGYDVKTSVARSKKYITGALKNGLNIGTARGPLNHLYDL